MDADLEDRLPIADLDDPELEVLIGLMLHLAEADDEVSPEESAYLKEVSAKLGREVFMARATAARSRFVAMDDVFDAAREVERPGARRAIFQSVRDLAMGDGIVAEEAMLLSRLATLWVIDWR